MTNSVTQGPFQNADVFAYAMSFANASDFFNTASVCKQFKQFTDELTGNPILWKVYSENVGIPMVCTEAGPRDCRADFRAIYPVTSVSGEVYRKIFGEPEGEVPNICVEIFDRFSQLDPFDDSKYQKETWQLIVEYPFVHRVLDKSIPFSLDANGNLVDGDPAGTGDAAHASTRIAMSSSNIIKLSKYPLMGKKVLSVFGEVDPRIMSQCDSCPIKVNVYYQKINPVARGIPYPQQKEFVKRNGFEVMAFAPRLLSDAIEIIQFATCPDDLDAYSRTSSLILWDGGDVYPAAIGCFMPSWGVSVDDLTFTVEDCYTVAIAVGIPAEAK